VHGHVHAAGTFVQTWGRLVSWLAACDRWLTGMPLYEEKFICPFSIRFSQARIRPTFQDGREVEASMEQISAVSCPEGPLQQRYDVLLRAPFPPIEIIRWWPKLREEDGETLLDENGKTILGEPCWFTFDNRRLYCLQAAAIKNWPSRTAAVVHVMHDLPVSKCAPKKFRTTDLGCSVRISRRDDVVPKATWTWMEAAGRIDRESEDYRKAMEAIFADGNKEHWSELLDVPPNFTREHGVDDEEYQLYRPKFDEEAESTVNTRTARRILKAGGCRVSRGGTEAQAAAATVAAAAAAAAKASTMATKRSKESSGSVRPEEATEAVVETPAETPWDALGAQFASSSKDAASGFGYEGSGYFKESEYGGDLNLYQLAAAAAAYNGAAQASLAWQFQQQMMHNMQMQQFQQQRLQQLRDLRQKEKKKAQQAQQAQQQAQQALLALAAKSLPKAAAKAAAKAPSPSSPASISEVGSTLRQTVNGAAGGLTNLTTLGAGGATKGVSSGSGPPAPAAPAPASGDVGTGTLLMASTQASSTATPASPVSSSSAAPSQPSQPGLLDLKAPSQQEDDVDCNQQ